MRRSGRRSSNWPGLRRIPARLLMLPSALRGVFAVYAEAHGAGLEPGRLNAARLGLRFSRDLCAALPLALRWLARGDQSARGAMRLALGLGRLPPAPPIDPAQLCPGAVGAFRPPVTLVLPLTNGCEGLPECLERIVAHTDLDWHLIAVADSGLHASTVARLAALGPRATLIELPPGSGRAAAVERGLAAALARSGGGPEAGPCILIRPDALLPPGWASRLVAPLEDPGVATVTPLSNAGGVAAVPVIGADVTAGLLAAGAVDAALARLDSRYAVASIPVPVTVTGGACMAISHPWLARVADFGPGAGFGAGEDWCRRIATLGARHLLSGAVFVAQSGGEGPATGEEPVPGQPDAAILPGRAGRGALPGDPAVGLRLAAGLAMAGAVGELPVYLAHAMGGGAEHWLQGRLRAHRFAVVLRFGGVRRCQIVLATPWGETRGDTGDLDLVAALLAFAPRKRLILSSIAGDRDPLAVLDRLGRLAAPGTGFEAVVHDHHPISPSFTLLDADGVYRGLPGVDGSAAEETDPAHRFRRPDGRVLALGEWQAAWGRFLSACDSVTCFSADSRDKMAAVHPGLAGRLRVVPHDVPRPAPVSPPAGDGIVLGILGNILGHKGADVVRALAKARAPGVRLVVVGTLDPALGRLSGVAVTGRYVPVELPRLAQGAGITHWLIPSVWPETFSLTTHEALATGLPVLALDLGAQGAAVRAAANGIPVPYVAGGDHAGAILRALTQRPAGGGGPSE